MSNRSHTRSAMVMGCIRIPKSCMYLVPTLSRHVTSYVYAYNPKSNHW